MSFSETLRSRCLFAVFLQGERGLRPSGGEAAAHRASRRRWHLLWKLSHHPGVEIREFNQPASPSHGGGNVASRPANEAAGFRFRNEASDFSLIMAHSNVISECLAWRCEPSPAAQGSGFFTNIKPITILCGFKMSPGETGSKLVCTFSLIELLKKTYFFLFTDNDRCCIIFHTCITPLLPKMFTVWISGRFLNLVK